MRQRPPPFEDYLQMVKRAIASVGAQSVCLTGGEPFLFPQLWPLARAVRTLGCSLELITNGGHITEGIAEELQKLEKTSVQLTLLAGRKALHDALKGTESFDQTLRATLWLLQREVPVRLCFVSTHANWRELGAVLQLGAALGVRHFSYNRMSPAGASVKQLETLLPRIAEVEANLEEAERWAVALGLTIHTAMPVPPCVLETSRYPHIRFGSCSNGPRPANLVVDPLGNVRMCNLASEVLGNFYTDDWAQLRKHPRMADYRKEVPDFCQDCAVLNRCGGGCREAAFAVFGQQNAPDPFVEQARKPRWLQGWAASRRESAAAPGRPHRAASSLLFAPGLSWRVAPEVEAYYRILATIKLGADAASLFQPSREPIRTSGALLEAYRLAPGRLRCQFLPLETQSFGELLERLSPPLPPELSDGAGSRLAQLLREALLQTYPEVCLEMASSRERWETSLRLTLEALAEPLQRLRRALFERRELPPLVLYPVPALGTHGRATFLAHEHRIAVSTLRPWEEVLCQVLHEQIHAVTDPLTTLPFEPRATHQGDGGYPVHARLEAVALEVGAALVAARAPELVRAYHRWAGVF